MKLLLLLLLLLLCMSFISRGGVSCPLEKIDTKWNAARTPHVTLVGAKSHN